MQLTVRQQNNWTIVTPSGPRLDAMHTLEFKEQMRDIIADTQNAIILDMHKVEFLDSSGLGAIVAVSRLLQDKGKLQLAALAPVVKRVFHLTRMDQIFHVHETLDGATV